jgi:flagellar basal-body rod modification protein FlgD
MPMNSVDLKQRISPPSPTAAPSFSDLGVKTQGDAKDSTDVDRTSFKDLLYNSNDDMARTRAAQKNGDLAKAAKTDEEFAKAMQDKLNKENLRTPQNNLDKDAFLKLFITQMQNQDPLNPDKSSEMAAQLAQFHGLEQMLNVNKNLEKMSNEQAIGRAVGLVDFVGKDVKLANGKLKLDNGNLTDAYFDLGTDSPHTTMEVRDAAGVVVATKDLGMQSAGEHKVDWDGKNNSGEKVPNGAYTISVIAKDFQNNDVPVKLTSNVKVTGVDLQDAGGSFFTEIGRVRIADVASVGEAGFVKAAADQAKKGVEKPAAAVDAAATDAARAATSDEDAVKAEMQQAVQSPGSTAPQPAVQPVAAPAGPAPQQPGIATNSLLSPTSATPGTAFEIPVPPQG